MADQLVTLGLDEKEYQDGLKSLMRQSRGEFQKMKSEVSSPFKAFARGAMYMSGLQKSIAFGSRALEAYARSSESARREVDQLTGSIDRMYASIGGDLAKLAGGTGGVVDQVDEARVSFTDALADIIASVRHFQKPGAQIEAMRQERESLKMGIELERARMLRVGDEQGLLDEQQQWMRAIGMDREAGHMAALSKYVRKQAELREAVKDGRMSRESADSILEVSARLRDAEIAKVERDADARIDKQRADEGDRLMERESEATREAIEQAEQRAQEIGELDRMEADLRLEALRSRGLEHEAEKEAAGMRLERDLRDIRLSEHLSAEERSAREARIRAHYGQIEAKRPREHDTLQSVAAGTSGLGSVIAGAFGRDLRGGDSGKMLDKVRAASERTAANSDKLARDVAAIVAKVGVAVYG